MKLHSTKKTIMDIASARAVPIEETLHRVIPLAKLVGVTRIADITNMDSLGIPNYSSVLPGTEDTIWVYNGKGPTKKHALASVIMESIERYSAMPSSLDRRFVVGSYKELSRSYSVLHPDEVVEPLRFQYKDDMVLDFIAGTDLLSNTSILVPAAIALYRYGSSSAYQGVCNSKRLNPFLRTHTIGLASGNVLEEAICHALCEVIEHDSSSIAELVASAIPYTILTNMAESLKAIDYPVKPMPSNAYVDDNSIFSRIELSGLNFAPAKGLLQRFERAKVPLLLKDITSDIGIPTFIASSFEWITHDYAFSAYGLGTHPDTRMALVRAVTEVAQTRAVNSQGSRDDLKKIRYEEDNYQQHKRSWKFAESKEIVSFSAIKSYDNDDILEDIKLILSRLKRSGLRKAIIVDLTNPNIGIPVVRALIPGLENFDETKSIMGKRAKESFKRIQHLKR